MDEFDIHNIERQFEQFQDKLKNSGEISDVNRKDILNFQRNCFAEGIGTGRVLKYSLQLFTISKWLPVSLKEATKEHIIDLVQELERKKYSEWTKHDYKVTLKKAYRWLRNTEEGYPPEVRWIKTGMKNSKKKLPEELLDVEDVKKLIEAAQHPRDKAFVSVLYESGARIGEIATLRIKHAEFDNNGAKLMVTGKTGMRRVRIIGSVSYLTNWVDHHPNKNDPESPLWLSIGSNNHNQKITYRALSKRLKEIGEKAYIKKIELKDVKLGKDWRDFDIVEGYVKNKGDKDVDFVELTIYYLDINNIRIGEESFRISGFSLNTFEAQPLKPNYSEDFSFGLDTPPEWSGKIEYEITKIEFS